MNCPACKQAMPETAVLFDLNTGLLAWPDGSVQLTRQQAEIFHILWEAQPRYTSLAQLCARINGIWVDRFTDNGLKTQICFIRGKLKAAAAPVALDRRYGAGYRVEVLA